MSVRQRRIWVLVIILAFSFFSSDFLRCSEKKNNVTVGVEIGNIAPDFSLYDISGKLYRLKDIRVKKPVLLVFWATWCPYCVREIPQLNEIYQKYSKKGLEVWAIDINESKGKVSGFIAKKGINYTILLDSEGSIASLYQIHGIPTNIILDKDGIVQHNGGLPENYDELFAGLTGRKK